MPRTATKARRKTDPLAAEKMALAVATAGARTAIERARAVTARYDAAQTNDLNSRHWSAADALSADAAASQSVRQTLRQRARYEIANNCFARGIVNTLAADVVGTGPRLQLQTPDAGLNRDTERDYHAWQNETGLVDKLRTMWQSRVGDGEAFALFGTNQRLSNPVHLDIRLVESDQFTRQFVGVTYDADDYDTDGIDLDAAGNPVSYSMLTRHPGASIGAVWDYIVLPARSVLHTYRADRPGQHRGIPEIAPALPLFALLRRFTLATVHAAETAAEFAAILRTTGGPDQTTAEVDPFLTLSVERNMLTAMPAGWSMEQFKAEHPNATFAEFRRAIITEVARCLSVPFNVASGDSASYNFASGRLDYLIYCRARTVEQEQLGRTVMDRVLAEWLAEYQLSRGVRVPVFASPGTLPPHEWLWDEIEAGDPQTLAAAQEIRLRSGMTTRAREYARRKLDWEAEAAQRAREYAFDRANGLPTTTPGAPPTPPPKDDTPSADRSQQP